MNGVCICFGGLHLIRLPIPCDEQDFHKLHVSMQLSFAGTRLSLTAVRPQISGQIEIAELSQQAVDMNVPSVHPLPNSRASINSTINTFPFRTR
jgi:hypothetical protein